MLWLIIGVRENSITFTWKRLIPCSINGLSLIGGKFIPWHFCVPTLCLAQTALMPVQVKDIGTDKTDMVMVLTKLTAF